MKITNKPDQVIVEHEGLTFVFNFNTLYKDILKSDILKYISLLELRLLFLIGTPNNIKEFLHKKIEFYDSSSEVNSFIYKNKEYWLDSKTRSNLYNLSKTNLDTIDFILEDAIIKISSDKLQKFINDLEVYAHKCYVNTFKHLKTVDTLTDIEDIFNYNYTTGYPEKITLE